MTAVDLRSSVRWWSHPATLWVAFIAVHVWLMWLGLVVSRGSLGDVTGVYPFWVQGLLNGQFVVGVDTPWVYPIVALVPLLVPALAGMGNYVVSWLIMVSILDLVAFFFLVRGARVPSARPLAAWWWILSLLALGPVALGRIDSVVTPIAILGLLFLLTRPALAGVLLALGTWLKVWPVALVASAFILLRRRWALVAGGALFSGVVIAVGLVLGAGVNLFSFLGFQGSRGLQIESPAATPFLWLASLGDASTQIYFDKDMLTYQVSGPGVSAVASVMTALMAGAVLVVAAVTLWRLRHARAPIAYLPASSLAFVLALIAFNKVGSPQYFCWLIPPILLGLLLDRARFVPLAVIALASILLTQMVYPWMYDDVLELKPMALVFLSVRNLSEVALFGYALALVARRRQVT